MSDDGHMDYNDDDNKDEDCGDDMQSEDDQSLRESDSPEESGDEDSNSDSNDLDDEDEASEDSEYADNIDVLHQYGNQKPTDNKERVTPPFLTKYEKARIIGTRALQIAQNSPIYVDTDEKDYDPIAIAEKEFVQKKIPFIIRRYLPNKSYEDWPLDQLEVLD